MSTPIAGSEAASAASSAPRSAVFRREREAAWRELEELIRKVERGGIASLNGVELHRLPSLYRAAVSALAVARATSLDKNLLDYLTALVGRAYVCVYSTKRQPGQALREFVLRRFPTAVRRNFRYLAAATLLMAAGVVVGWALVLADVERYWTFVPGGMAQGRDPLASDQELRAVLYDTGGEDGWIGTLHLFATFLFTHNSKIAILCFALGFAAGAPVVYLLFYNGLLLGAMAALYQTRGLGLEFWAWVLPHGVTELGAIVLCGAAGLALGMSLVFPGRHTRMQNLAIRGREVAVIAIGAVGMLFIAAIIEGFFRQLVQDVAVRASVASLSLVFWILYFGFAGRGAQLGDRW